jgi:hypothetical protein
MRTTTMWTLIAGLLVGCGGGPTFECACSGADVAYQAEADPGGVASEATCSSGYEFQYVGDDGQTVTDAEAGAAANCCAPGATDCTCSCTEL